MNPFRTRLFGRFSKDTSHLELGGAFGRFRAAHGLIGHAWYGYGFDLADECTAWSAQDRRRSRLARWAPATEIYGVNAARSIVGNAPDFRALLLAPTTLRHPHEEGRETDFHLVI